MGFWVKNQINKRTETITNQYLYYRYSIYQRDKRTLKRKPRKLGDGTFNQNKYIKRKDYYLGKIVTTNPPKKFIMYQEYMKEKGIIDLDTFFIEKTYEEIFESYLNYLIELYNLDKELLFNNNNLITYETTAGYISKRLLEWVHNFNFHQKLDPTDEREIDRFAGRCEFIGISDPIVISALFKKICPEIDQEDMINALKEEIEELDKQKTKKIVANNFKDFIENG